VVEIGNGANQPANRRAIHAFLDVVDGKLTVAAKMQESDPFVDAQCTAEVSMDIEILAALAPAAHIVVYFASSDDQGLYHAINYAVHDEKHRPGILSISWSIPEHTLPHSEIEAIEGVLREAAHLGITVCASSGDAGALNGSTDGKPSVNYPASSPHCLACGGTSGKVDTKGIAEEVVWNATHYGFKGASGGGVSQRFQVPEWQKDARVPDGPAGKSGRGVPDVAGLADPRFGCELLVAGRSFTSAGTSAVAPLWAALIARLNQALGHRCGHLHSHIYSLGKERRTALRPVVKGNNGLYRAGEGWNACTGYGTPRGKDLLVHLKKGLSARGSRAGEAR
jgi:kumamolisin